MWVGYEDALRLYYNQFWETSVGKWKVKAQKLQLLELENKFSVKMPEWLGNDLLHASHRGRLLDKNYEYYSQFK
jgi:hypothetical protein